jgi:3-hexulose-6-phosphate synthase / 6-phospho-3-hexuloisomerase
MTEITKESDRAAAIRAKLDQVSTANVSDAWNRHPSLHGIRALIPGSRACGQAVTVRTCPGDYQKPVAAIDVCKAGEVLVFDAGNSYPAIWGELATHCAMYKGIAGLIVWGAIRDTTDITAAGFPAFSSLVCADAGEPDGLGAINVPITIAGQTVHPGDWVLADDDGVMVIPDAQVEEIAEAALAVFKKETGMRLQIDAGASLAEVNYHLSQAQ